MVARFADIEVCDFAATAFEVRVDLPVLGDFAVRFPVFDFAFVVELMGSLVGGDGGCRAKRRGAQPSDNR
jgi:hypothetical protein